LSKQGLLGNFETLLHLVLHSKHALSRPVVAEHRNSICMGLWQRAHQPAAALGMAI
jgi:hypothetical protein